MCVFVCVCVGVYVWEGERGRVWFRFRTLPDLVCSGTAEKKTDKRGEKVHNEMVKHVATTHHKSIPQAIFCISREFGHLSRCLHLSVQTLICSD